MKKIFILLIFAILFSSCSQSTITSTSTQVPNAPIIATPTENPIQTENSTLAPKSESSTLEYKVSVDCIKSKTITVNLTFTSKFLKYPNSIYMSFSSGAYWKDDFYPPLIKYVKGFRATDGNNNELVVRILPKANGNNNDLYVIENIGNTSIKITYQVPVGLKHSNGSLWGGYVGKNYCVIDPGIMFLYPTDIERNKDLYGDVKIYVQYQLPKDWEVVSFWEKDKDGNYIGLPSALRMTKGPVGFGKFTSKQEIIDGKRIVVAVADGAKKPDSIIDTSFDIYNLYETKIYGSFDNYNGSIADGYISIFLPTGNVFSNLYHEAYGQFLAMPANFWPDYIHCIGHNWTAQIEYKGDLWYVTEGFTQYIQLKIAVDKGLIDESYRNSEMRRYYREYTKQDGVLDGSHSYSVPYNKGPLFAYVLDNIIVDKSNGKYSIYDLLKAIYQKSFERTRITSITIKALTEDLIGYDLTPIFNLYVLGLEKLPVYIDNSGAVKIEMENLPQITKMK